MNRINKKNWKQEAEITVVLSAYKRIDSLRMQYESILAQTLAPKAIVLFQDAVDKDYKITIDRSLIEKFDHVCISEKNAGVWGRFKYASELKTEYVCIFDDDTMPGPRWLETCVRYMKMQEGVYVTNGVILTDPVKYPWGGYVNSGWMRSYPDLREVDFGGHAWFAQTAWLKYMFEDDAHTKYKYSGEDMALSYGCMKHGIHTYTPPHPDKDMTVWGSQPETGRLLGHEKVGLSISGDKSRMNEAVKYYLGRHWDLLYKRRPEYCRKMIRSDKKKTWNMYFKRIMGFVKRSIMNHG